MKMSEPGERRGEHTREAILTAAEAIFAEHGFDGARIDRIAETSGYNKTLIFRYFGDKLGLYAEVLRRIDQHMHELLAHVIEPLLEDETLTSNAQRFRMFLKAALGAFFDYMVEHPQVMRMIIWEHAEGWKTYTKLASLFEVEGLDQLEALFARGRRAGFFRSDLDPLVLFMLAEQICWSYLTSLPLYQLVLPQRDFSSAESRAQAREQIIEFIVSGVLVDAKDDEDAVVRREENQEQTLREK
jgi:TetR/AcrR family transcriptional regulator